MENSISGYLNDRTLSKVTLKGTVAENPEVKPDRIRLLLDNLMIDAKNIHGMVLASIYKNKFKELGTDSIAYGSIVEIEGTLERLPHRRNPGEFDYGEYLKLHNIDAVFYAYGFDKIKVTGLVNQNFCKGRIVNPVRNYSIRIIDEYIGGNEGEYLKGLVLGERSNISKEIREDFVNAGVAHIIAVSGLNIAYVLIIIWAILVFVPVGQIYKFMITVLLLVFYMNLTGNTPSIVRATIMASVLLLAQVFERKTSFYNIVSFSALIILVVDPRQLFDAGFILSYSAILSILILYPKITEWLNKVRWYANLNTENFAGKSIRIIIGLLFGTLAAQIGTLPITALMFKKISMVSLIANLFAIPLSNISLALGFMVIIAASFSSWLASVFASANALLMFSQLKAISFCANLDYSFVETYFVNYYFLFVYYLILVLMFTVTAKNFIPRLVIVLLLVFNFVTYSRLAGSTDKAKITYIDLGNSNSSHIKMPGGTNILINSGNSTDRFFTSERYIIPYLKNEGVSSIEILLVNSMNYSEYRNLAYFVSHFPVRKVIMPVCYKPIFDRSFAFAKVNVDYMSKSTIINKQGNFRIYIYYYPNLAGESMMTEFVYGEQSFMFNDSYNTEDDVINTSCLPDENVLMVLKASGSGSFNFNSAEFIAKSDPEFVVISSSDRGRKRVESEIFAKSLDESGYTVMKTSEEGAIIFETDGYVTGRVYWK